jgi:hypothetical protein
MRLEVINILLKKNLIYNANVKNGRSPEWGLEGDVNSRLCIF